MRTIPHRVGKSVPTSIECDESRFFSGKKECLPTGHLKGTDQRGASVMVIPAATIRSRIMSATANCLFARSSALIS